MTRISLTVNGKGVVEDVEPRTNLADFLREKLLLTGTHTGCEHGICGACTVVIDGEISRSCITWAVACDGAHVRTIEDFDNDAIMLRLREAFSAEHALQCGFCTPGMLIAARDLIRRHKSLDEKEIRNLMSGNLCRCTGYMGIVSALKSVLEKRPAMDPEPPMHRSLGPAPGPEAPDSLNIDPEPVPIPAATPKGPAVNGRLITSPAGSRISVGDVRQEGEFTALTQTITVAHPRDNVWAYMSDIEKVAACMPGVSLDGPPQNGHVSGRLAVKLGPIEADFAGEADTELRDSEWLGIVEGRGRDSRSSSRAKGRIEYRLKETAGGVTEIVVSISYSLAGPLAQFSRGAIVRDFVARLGGAFAQNLEARLSGRADTSGTEKRLDAGGLIFTVIWARIRSFFGRMLGRRR